LSHALRHGARRRARCTARAAAQLDDDLLVALLGDPDPGGALRRARRRGPYPAAVDGALLAALGDLDAGVRAAALGAIARNTPMHGHLVEPLRLVVQHHDQDTRAASTSSASSLLPTSAARRSR
jgi:hypothetical protein